MGGRGGGCCSGRLPRGLFLLSQDEFREDGTSQFTERGACVFSLRPGGLLGGEAGVGVELGPFCQRTGPHRGAPESRALGSRL